MNAAYYVVAAVVLGGAVYKTRDYVRAGRTSLSARYLALTFYALGAAFLLLANASRPVVDDLTGVECLARWAGNSATLLSAAAVQITFAESSRPTGSRPVRVRLRLTVLALVVAVMGVAMAVADVPDRDDFLDAYAGVAAVAVYLLAYLLYLGYAMADALVLSLRYASRAGSRAVRLGMRVVAAGSLTGLVYVGLKLVVVVLHLAGDMRAGEGGAGPALGLVAGLLLVVGATLGSWGPKVAERRARRRAFRALGPLWNELNEAFPQTHLRGRRRSGRTRLLRRVVEIRDGQLALQPYLTAEARAQAEAAVAENGLAEGDRAAALEAALIVIGLERKGAGLPPEQGSGGAAQAQAPAADPDAADLDAADPDTADPDTADLDGADLDTEVARLLAVARAYGKQVKA